MRVSLGFFITKLDLIVQIFCFKQKWNTLQHHPLPFQNLFLGGARLSRSRWAINFTFPSIFLRWRLFYRLSQIGCGQSDTPHSLESLLSDINIKWYLDTLGINTICEFTYIYIGMIQKIIFQCYRKKAPKSRLVLYFTSISYCSSYSKPRMDPKEKESQICVETSRSNPPQWINHEVYLHFINHNKLYTWFLHDIEVTRGWYIQ